MSGNSAEIGNSNSVDIHEVMESRNLIFLNTDDFFEKDLFEDEIY